MPRKSRSINYFMGGAEGQPSPAANTGATGVNTKATGVKPANNSGTGVRPANIRGTNSITKVNMETPESGKKGTLENAGEQVMSRLKTTATTVKEQVINPFANAVNNNIVEPIKKTAGLSPSSAPEAQPEPAAPSTSTPPEASQEEGNSVLYYILIVVCVIIIIALIYYIYKVYFVTEKYEDKEDENDNSLNSFKDFDEKNLSHFTVDDANDIIKIF
jgi:hypothetical protein